MDNIQPNYHLKLRIFFSMFLAQAVFNLLFGFLVLPYNTIIFAICIANSMNSWCSGVRIEECLSKLNGHKESLRAPVVRGVFYYGVPMILAFIGRMWSWFAVISLLMFVWTVYRYNRMYQTVK